MARKPNLLIYQCQNLALSLEKSFKNKYKVLTINDKTKIDKTRFSVILVANNPQDLASIVRKNDLVIYLSNDSVFGMGGYFDNTSLTNAETQIGKTKIIEEDYVAKKFKNYIILRHSEVLTKEFLDSMFAKIDTSINVNHFTYPLSEECLKDFIEILISSRKDLVNGIVHLCSDKNYNDLDFIKLLAASRGILNRTYKTCKEECQSSKKLNGVIVATDINKIIKEWASQ